MGRPGGVWQAKHVVDVMNIEERLEALRNEVRRHDRFYYLEGKPEIGDREYDALYAELVSLEQAHPELASDDSPTQRVAGAPLKEFVTVPHRLPMLSLDNTYSAADLQRFHEYVRRGLEGETAEYCIEPKIDGVSIALVYIDGKLARAVTRGNGKEGDDVTANVRTIPSVPLRLAGDAWPHVLEVRGEVCMSREGFQRLNRQRQAAGEEEFANPRNATAGSLKQLDARVVAQRPLDVFVYALGEVDGIEIGGQLKMFTLFRRYGLKTQGWLRQARDYAGLQQAIDELQLEKGKFPYDIDGAVIKVENFAQRERLGMTAKAPSWAKAYKYEPERGETRLQAITIQVGRTGNLTPVAELEPVLLSGSTISRATLHNEDEIRRKDIRAGDWVVIEKAGEVIPAVVRVVAEKRPAGTVPFDFCGHLGGCCPSCGTAIVRDPKFAAWRCPNVQCPAQSVRRLEYFAARNALNLESLGGVVAEALVESGLVAAPLDLFALDVATLGNLNLGSADAPRQYGVKNAAKLLQALARTRTLPLSNWLQAMGIPEVGAASAYQIGRTHQTLEEVADSPWLKGLLNLLSLQDSGRLEFPESSAADADLGDLFSWQSQRRSAPEQIRELAARLLPTGLIRPAEGRGGVYVTTSIGPKTARAVLDFFAGEAGQGWLQGLRRLGIAPLGDRAATAAGSAGELPLAGKTFVLTGTLQSMGREAAGARIRTLGGTVSTSVSRNTTYLVAGGDVGARKSDKARELGVQVIGEEEFLRLCGDCGAASPE